MADTMFKKLEKQNGKDFARTLRDHHNGLLEIANLDEILRHAGRDVQPLLPYLMSLLAANDNAPASVPVPEDPFTLLDRAGYEAFHADTLEKQNSISPYFRENELLCTFNDNARYQNYHIVHAVKKNVDDIIPAAHPDRQDAYSTSVISIQMYKGGGHIKITSRYNHSVKGCDHTFYSNPDNIIDGLSHALKTHFNVGFEAPKVNIPDGFRLVKGRIFKYYREDNNIFYGDPAWVQGGQIHEVDRRAGDAMFEGFVFDNKSKKLIKIDPECKDSFADDFNRDYRQNPALRVKNGNLILKGNVLIDAQNSRIKTLDLPALTSMGSHCLFSARAMERFSAPNVTAMDDFSLWNARSLTHLDLPSLVSMGKSCVWDARSLGPFHPPALTSMGTECFTLASPESIKEIIHLRPKRDTSIPYIVFDEPGDPPIPELAHHT